MKMYVRLIIVDDSIIFLFLFYRGRLFHTTRGRGTGSYQNSPNLTKSELNKNY